MNNHKTGRNESCPCGSGKKFKKCCGNKQPRSNAIVFDMGEPVKIDQFSLLPNGEIKILSEGKEINPKNIFEQNLYQRNNGKEKILNQTKLVSSRFNSGMEELLNFDIIYAVDTNTKQLNNEKISACTIIKCVPEKDVINGEIKFQYCVIDILHAKNLTIFTEEKQAIVEVIRKITNDPYYNERMKFAIITDHDLGNIHKYNSQEIPFYQIYIFLVILHCYMQVQIPGKNIF